MTTEFNLSEKIKYTKKDGLFNRLRCHALDKNRVYPELDVKEFIRLLKEKGKSRISNDNNEYAYILSEEEIDKLAGEKLVPRRNLDMGTQREKQ